jgi:hypothetical protein
MKFKSLVSLCTSMILASCPFSGLSAQAAPLLPDFSAATFVAGAPVNNLYFPLLDSKSRAFEGFKNADGELSLERFELTTLGAGPTILGVQTTTRRDRAFEQGLLVEETFDYYAQDNAGNVWYFGEDVTNFIYDDNGNLISTNNSSAWRAGANGALPGFAMPADLTLGFNYYQEFAANDAALDQGTTFATGKLVSLGIGAFGDVLQVLETSELSPDSREFKYYAPGLGLVLVEERLNEQFADPNARIELVTQVNQVPAPSMLPLVGLGCVGLLRQRKRWARRAH